MKRVKPKYEVLIAAEWCRCASAQVQPSKWLDYALRDGTVGLAPSNKWREVPAHVEKGAYKADRRRGIEVAERLAKAARTDSLPLDVVAPLLPVVPEWWEFMKPRRR
jgi:hypothetical protein